MSKITLTHVIHAKSTISCTHDYPVLRDIRPNIDVMVNSNHPSASMVTLGKDIGKRVLPYTVQNEYDEKSSEVPLTVITLENDYLRVSFLPELGGRIKSIYHKKHQKELIYFPKEIRVANLAARNAWFAGGVEWNIGHFGHSFLTHSPVFFSKSTHEILGDYLRLYAYERNKGIIYGMDFYLPEGEAQLFVGTNVINVCQEKLNLYQWVNIALPEMDDSQYFTNATDVFFIRSTEPKVNLTLEKLPHFTAVEGNPTIPSTVKRSVEFYTDSKSKHFNWQAVKSEQDCYFYEASAESLNYKKLFCWGNHTGGLKWQNILSGNHHEKYLEIQSGITPTQFQCYPLATNQSHFTFHAMGAFSLGSEGQPWESTNRLIEDQLKVSRLTEKLALYEEIFKTESLKPHHEILFEGDGWGMLDAALSLRKTNKVFPEWYKFRSKRVLELDFWNNILELHPVNVDKFMKNKSYVTNTKWLVALEEHAFKFPITRWLMYLHMGIIWFENLNLDKARLYLDDSLRLKRDKLNLKVRGDYALRVGSVSEAIEYYELVPVTETWFKDTAFVLEILKLYNIAGRHEAVWDVYLMRPTLCSQEDIRVQLAISASKLNKVELLKEWLLMPYHKNREGDNTLSELWENHFSEPIPEHIDYKMR